MMYLHPVLSPSMHDWGNFYVLQPDYIFIECEWISHVVTNNLPFTIKDIKIQPNSATNIRSFNEAVSDINNYVPLSLALNQ